ncbi:MAG: nucleotidyl transferase AbiEii/AbiGii toxin family protein [Bacteroidales bacterium]|nr:nucleotidyl transferase AbiEii/AbiGii toxin family protein [Bacteroidales bacterium]
MILHENKREFTEAIQAASDHFNIPPVFIEKDYWITRVLKDLSKSKYANEIVFKGGTSLTKAYKLIQRFSEDVDIAVLNASLMSGNQVKTLIRNVEKDISKDLTEIEVSGVTSKFSKFRKSVFTYPLTGNFKFSAGISDKLIIEVNSFANPFPYHKLEIKSFITEFLELTDSKDLIKKYDLESFTLNVLDKKQTLLEKIVSLIRFSFDENVNESIASKIRHFYDIHFLLTNEECAKYIQSDKFKEDFKELVLHDKLAFDEPEGWKEKDIDDSPLINEFNKIWDNVKSKYTSELTALSYEIIPEEKDVKKSFENVIEIIKKD